MAWVRIVQDGVVGPPLTDLNRGLDVVDNSEAAVWFAVTRDELPLVASRLHMHQHAVEDAANEGGAPQFGQRTKIDRYPRHVFLYLYRTRLGESGELHLNAVSAFVGQSFVVVVTSPEGLDQAELVSRWAEHPDLVRHGTAGLLHGLLDLVVDSHLQTVDAISDRVDDMEDLLFDSNVQVDDDPRLIQQQSYATRKALVRLRRIAQPMRELVGGIMRSEEDDATPVDAQLMPYYQDVYDHVLRVNDSIEGLRDLLTTMYETRLALADHTLNTVMKKLTGWAAIIAVITAVTGFYGQNVPYPGFLRPAGFWTSTLVWVSLSLTLFVVLRRRRWI